MQYRPPDALTMDRLESCLLDRVGGIAASGVMIDPTDHVSQADRSAPLNS